MKMFLYLILKYITRNMLRRSSRLNTVSLELKNELNLNVFLKKNLKKNQICDKSKNIKFVHLFYNFLYKFKEDNEQYNNCSFYFLFQSNVFQNPLLVIQLYLLNDIVIECNKLINLHTKSYYIKPLFIIINNLIELNNEILLMKENYCLKKNNLVKDNFLNLHRLIEKIFYESKEIKALVNDSKIYSIIQQIKNVKILVDEVIDFQNEDELNKLIPILNNFHL